MTRGSQRRPNGDERRRDRRWWVALLGATAHVMEKRVTGGNSGTGVTDEYNGQ